MTSVARPSIALDDCGALSRRLLEYEFELAESRFRYFSAVKEELFMWSNEVTGGELAQKFLVDEALHGSARSPAEEPTYQQTHAIARLKFDDFEIGG